MEPLPADKVVKKAGAARRKKRPNLADAMFEPKNWPANNVELWPLRRIKPYENNPRTHPPAQIALLAELLKKYGVDQPIVVDENGEILKGHGRRLAAVAAGLDEFPVVQHLGLSEADKIAMRIQDNQVALLSGWDQEIIRGEIATLKLAGFETSLLGFGDAQLVQFTTTPGPPDAFKQFGDDIDTKYCCPRCSYAWSGNPQAGKDPDEIAAAQKADKKTNGKKKK